MPELELSLEPHAVASLSVFYGVDSIPDELLASWSYLSQCHHLDTHSPTPTPPPTREREKTFKERSLGKRGGAKHKTKRWGRKEGNKKRRNEVCSRGKGGEEEEEEGKSKHKLSRDTVFRS